MGCPREVPFHEHSAARGCAALGMQSHGRHRRADKRHGASDDPQRGSVEKRPGMA